ncbi:DUF2953 domain-containing protein [Camelliibacillus cellulosilyticus]|uniref:DUF2953 domain-containing protein n=1 Tax=Camelliibacillus cellulosilyticus TaxID=2174486 RepID=A0ABV9GIZ5_9BACL
MLLLASSLILFAVLLTVLIIYGPVKSEIDGRLNGTDIDFTAKIKFYGIRLFTLQIPKASVDLEPLSVNYQSRARTAAADAFNEKHLSKDEIKQMMNLGRRILDDIVFSDHPPAIFTSLKINRMKWATTVGLGEADMTATAVGLVWMIKMTACGVLTSWIKGMSLPKIDVRPVYETMVFRTHLTCMVSFRLGHAIRMVFRIAKLMKGRRSRPCQNIPFKA